MLKYVGKGAFLIGVPARDLTDEEIEKLGLDKKALIKSGLYEEDKPQSKAEKPYSKRTKSNPKQEYGKS